MHKSLFLPLCLAAVLTGCATTSTPKTGDERLKAQFQKADTNSDGKVSRKEFGALMIDDAFAMFDSNKNGVVTVEEFVAAGGSKAAFAKMDVNGDGVITLEEAKASKVAMDAMTVSFYGADLDKDGYVTLGEALEYRAKVREVTR